MKKSKLLNLKKQLFLTEKDEEAVFLSFMKTIEQETTSLWDIGEAFMFYNIDKAERIKAYKRQHKKLTGKAVVGATQFFTPKTLADFLVKNTLSSLDLDKPYRIFDPSLGVGNLFLAAYDFLESLYNEQGKPFSPEKLLSSFYGLELDDRATDFAKKLLLRRANLESLPLNFYSFNQPFASLAEIAEKSGKRALSELLRALADTPEIGSLAEVSEEALFEARSLKETCGSEYDDIFSIIELLVGRYDAILMNPPYLSSSDFGIGLKAYIERHYYNFRYDLFAVFIKRFSESLTENGAFGVLCPYNWMYIKSFSRLRDYILDKFSITNLLQLPYDGYSYAVVYLSAFTLRKNADKEGIFIKRLPSGEEERYFCKQERFKNTPNHSIIFWGSENFINNFSAPSLSSYLDIRQGMATGNNKKYLKKIADLAPSEIDFEAESLAEFIDGGKQYALYSKGGRYRKWYGNIEYALRFGDKERGELALVGNKMPSKAFYFKEGVSWTLVSSKGHFGARYVKSCVFDVGGSCGFVRENSPVGIFFILGFLCSAVATYYLNALNPTMNIQVGDLKNLPFILPPSDKTREIETLVKENVAIAKRDWEGKPYLEDDFCKLKSNEERINEIFISIYRLEGELDKTVPPDLITLKGKKH